MGLKDLVKKRETSYLFYSGKGGVGKTSMASASALNLSRAGRKVLIISTDPAHSLSDSFETQIGGEVKELGKNLFAVEIDPERAVEEYKERLSPKLEQMDALKGFGLEGMFDIAGMTPGIDEIAAFDKFLQYMHSKEYDIIIFDTAPTGHVLRFLSLPDVLDSWVGKMIKLRVKFSGMISMFKKILPFGDAGDESMGMEQLENMKKRIGEAKVILSDSGKTGFWLVLLAEQMSIFESERAMKTLKEYGITVSGIIVNQLVPESDCGFCKARRSMQTENLKAIHQRFKNMPIKEVQQYRHEIKGIEKLKELGACLSKSS